MVVTASGGVLDDLAEEDVNASGVKHSSAAAVPSSTGTWVREEVDVTASGSEQNAPAAAPRSTRERERGTEDVTARGVEQRDSSAGPWQHSTL